MARSSPQTLAKRQREQEKKRQAAEKRQRREERKTNPLNPEEQEIQVCRPILDDPLPR